MAADDKQIAHPRVLFVHFENQGGDWALVIPHAFGKNKHYRSAITEDLLLEFMPVAMTNILKGEVVTGVGCVPLIKEKGEDDAVSKEAKD